MKLAGELVLFQLAVAAFSAICAAPANALTDEEIKSAYEKCINEAEQISNERLKTIAIDACSSINRRDIDKEVCEISGNCGSEGGNLRRAPRSNAGAQNVNLTGVWHTVGGVTFYVRQIGDQIWWLGEKSPANPVWTNVATGTIDGGVVRVKWVDVPKGQTMHEGTLALRVVTPNHLVVVQNPNDFWSADWTR